MGQMKIDIGAALAPYCEPREDWILLDLDYRCTENCCNRPFMDIVADADHLPIRDNIFIHTRSGYCVLVYTTIKAFEEMIRITKPKGTIQLAFYQHSIAELLMWYSDNLKEDPDVLLTLLDTEAVGDFSRPGEPDDLGVFIVELYKRR